MHVVPDPSQLFLSSRCAGASGQGMRQGKAFIWWLLGRQGRRAWGRLRAVVSGIAGSKPRGRAYKSMR